MKCIKYYLLLIFGCMASSESISQSKLWEVYGGISYSNVMHLYEGQQTTLNHTLNAPLWNIGYQFGINRSVISFKDKLELGVGFRMQLKGDKRSFHQVFPEDTIVDIRFLYAMIPINVKWKILDTKEIYFKTGISVDYLVHANRVTKSGQITLFPAKDTFKEKLEVSCQLGFNFLIIKNVYAEVMYSQGLSPIAKVPYYYMGQIVRYQPYKHQAFEFTIMYKL